MLRYESASKVGASAVNAILSEAAGVQRQWWQGTLGFENEPATAPVVLRGITPLFRSNVPLEDDLFMAFGDMVAIVDLLADWSVRFNVKWRLHMNDEDWGAIDPTGPTPMLLDQMTKWSKRAKVPAAGRSKWLIPDTRRRDIGDRHGT
jgi:hypothetical protein